MRREWSQWIKHREWEAFEREAKTDPNQLLADTVGELARGFDERADRRALKRVLYLLEQAGFKPAEIEEPAGEPAAPGAPFSAALMTSADPSGSTFVMIGVESGSKVLWMRATFDEQYGVSDASEEFCSVEEAPAELDRMLRALRASLVSAEVPAEYALSRLARALGRQKGRAPSVVAYWRKHLEAAKALPHPTKAMKPPKASEDERYQLALAFPPVVPWRLELGTASARIMEFAEAIEEGEDPDTLGPKREAWMEENRSVLFTEPIAADHAMRLRDLAFLLHDTDPKQSGLVLAAAVDLEKRGADSDYARAVVDKTMYLTMRHLKSRSERE